MPFKVAELVVTEVAELVFTVGANAKEAPSPKSGTLSVGVSRSFDGILRFALFNPSDVGENTTSIVPEPDGAIVCAEQLSFWVVN